MSERFAYGLATADGGQSYDLDIFSDIGEASWFSDSVSANDVRYRLKNSPTSDVRLRLNTRGGDVLEGMAMYSLLAEHKGTVTAIVMGLCASAGTFPMLAASKIQIVEGGLVMIHNAWGGAVGKPDDLRAHADLLEKLSDKVADLYVARTKKPKAEIVALMTAETFMTADEALANGFVDEVIKFKAPTSATGKSKARASARSYSYALAMLQGENLAPPVNARAALEALAALEVIDTDPTPAPQPEPEPPPAPSPVPVPEPSPPAEPAQETSMTIPKTILLKLGLTEGAEESAVLASIDRLKTSAHAGSEIEKILGCVGAEAIGAVRGLKSSQETLVTLQADLGQVKATMARASFDAAVAQGRKERKLTTNAVADFTKRFDAAVAAGEDGTALVQELQGFIKLAAPYASNAGNARTGGGAGTGDGDALLWENKTYAQLSAGEKHTLKQRDPELFNLMRTEHLSQQSTH